MRRPRPTIGFLKMLPLDSFRDPVQRAQVSRGQWDQLDIGDIQHALIDDAHQRFADGLPDMHRSATQAAGVPVYEVRDQAGAAWRGAVVLDADGDPWLVYAERHNRFHRRAKSVLTPARLPGVLPLPAEYKLRAREEAARTDRQWRGELLECVVVAVEEALSSPSGSALARLPAPPGSRVECDITIELDHDGPTGAGPGDLELGSSMVTVGLVFPSKPDRPFRDAAIQEIVPFLQPSSGSIDSVYGRDGALHVLMMISQARLAQLIAASATGHGEVVAMGPTEEPDRLHYTASATLTEGFVLGKAVRAVCGFWFVPTRDESADLPICERCDQELGVAQRVRDAIQSWLARTNPE